MSLDLGDTSAGEFDPSSIGGLLLLVSIENNINPDQTAHIPGTCVSLYIYLLHYLLQKPEWNLAPRSYSTWLRTKFILLINVKMQTTYLQVF